MDEEDQRFKDMIQHYLSRVGYRDTDTSTVLDVACGKCHEAEVLFELFGERVIGIDKDPKEIEALSARIGQGKGRFFPGDATRLSQTLDQQVDIVIARHPSPGDGWKMIYGECYEKTAPDGLLISTYYSNLDYDPAIPLIIRAGYKILIAEENPFSKKWSTYSLIQTGIDRFVVVAQKKQKMKVNARIRDLLKRIL